MTAGVRQFIKDHLAEILAAESKGALPGDPKTLRKGKRQRPDDEDEDQEKELAARMITLVEVHRFVEGNQYVGINESTGDTRRDVSLG